MVLDWEAQPRPVFALSGRMLAFASPPPRPDSPPPGTTTTQHARQRQHSRPESMSGAATNALNNLGQLREIGNMDRAELGNAALKVGGTVLSGLWSAGRGAYSAARTKMSGAEESAATTSMKSGGSGLTGMWFSKSAPTQTDAGQQGVSVGGRVVSLNEDGLAVGKGGTVPVITKASSTEQAVGSFVTVVDLQSVLDKAAEDGRDMKPGILAEFVALKRQAISGLKFAEDGTNLVVVPEDGQYMRMFAIRPKSRAVRMLKGTGGGSGGEAEKVCGTAIS